MPRGGQGKRYPEDFKYSAIELVLSGDKSINEIAKDLGVNNKTLYGWVERYKKDHNLSNKSVKDSESLEAELKRLRKENAILKKEREILKKATAYFAKETL